MRIDHLRIHLQGHDHRSGRHLATTVANLVAGRLEGGGHVETITVPDVKMRVGESDLGLATRIADSIAAAVADRRLL